MTDMMTSEQYRRMLGLEETGDDMETAAHAFRGRKAQVAGQSFQDRLNAYHALLLKSDLFLYIIEALPPMRSVTQGRGKAPMYALLGTGPCDYVFAMTNGSAGMFDAKSTSKEKAFYWPKKSRHQLETLRALQRVSIHAAAFALVEWRVFDEIRLHPIITIDGHTVRRGDGVKVPDALPYPDARPWDAGPGWHVIAAEVWG